MSRRISEDFEDFVDFLAKYKLGEMTAELQMNAKKIAQKVV